MQLLKKESTASVEAGGCVKYVVNTNFDGVRESLLESFCLSERACREKELLFGNGTIYKDKRPLPFKEAYK